MCNTHMFFSHNVLLIPSFFVIDEFPRRERATGEQIALCKKALMGDGSCLSVSLYTCSVMCAARATKRVFYTTQLRTGKIWEIARSISSFRRRKSTCHFYTFFLGCGFLVGRSLTLVGGPWKKWKKRRKLGLGGKKKRKLKSETETMGNVSESDVGALIEAERCGEKESRPSEEEKRFWPCIDQDRSVGLTFFRCIFSTGRPCIS